MRLNKPGLVGFPFTHPSNYFSAILESLALDVEAETRPVCHYNVDSSALSSSVSRHYLPVLGIVVDLVIAPTLLTRVLPILRRLDCSFFEVEDVVGSWDVLSGLEFEQLIVSSVETVENELASVEHALTAVYAEGPVIS